MEDPWGQWNANSFARKPHEVQQKLFRRPSNTPGVERTTDCGRLRIVKPICSNLATQHLKFEIGKPLAISVGERHVGSSGLASHSRSKFDMRINPASFPATRTHEA